MRRALLAALAALSCLAAAASDPAERLPDPAQEARARAMFKALRCVVCQNESIDESNAEIAGDLRRVVRREIAAGRSDEQVRDFMVGRYGQFILLKPPFNAGNAVLWLSPLLVLGLGGAYLLWQAARPRGADDKLSEEEEARLLALTGTSAIVPPENGPKPEGPK